MGGALVHGLASAGKYDVTACDVDPKALATVSGLDITTTTDPDEAANAEVVILAVKPEIVGPVLTDLELSADQTLVSIAAGVSTVFLEKRTEASVVRVMPNLAAAWGSMAAAMTGDGIDDDIRRILSDLGTVVEVDEEQMDISTAVNGSGPAFVFYVIQAMMRAGIESGLEAEEAKALTAQTFKGAAETVLRSDESLQELIDAVCSPNGTTIEGMAVLRESEIDETVADAVHAAERRGRELAAEVTNE